MRKIILYIAASLDGYIADNVNSVDFLNVIQPEDANDDYGDFISSCDTVIMGQTTYLQIINELSPEVWPHSGQKTYVISDKELELKEGVETFSGDIRELVTTIQSTESSNIFLVGGGNTIKQFLEYNLVDEFHIFYFPIILGGGVKLWPDNIDRIVLHHTGTQTIGKDAKMVKLSYMRY